MPRFSCGHIHPRCRHRNGDAFCTLADHHVGDHEWEAPPKSADERLRICDGCAEKLLHVDEWDIGSEHAGICRLCNEHAIEAMMVDPDQLITVLAVELKRIEAEAEEAAEDAWGDTFDRGL